MEAANVFTKRTELILADMRVRYELEKKAEEIRGSDERLKAAEDNLLSGTWSLMLEMDSDLTVWQQNMNA